MEGDTTLLVLFGKHTIHRTAVLVLKNCVKQKKWGKAVGWDIRANAK